MVSARAWIGSARENANEENIGSRWCRRLVRCLYIRENALTLLGTVSLGVTGDSTGGWKKQSLRSRWHCEHGQFPVHRFFCLLQVTHACLVLGWRDIWKGKNAERVSDLFGESFQAEEVEDWVKFSSGKTARMLLSTKSFRGEQGREEVSRVRVLWSKVGGGRRYFFTMRGIFYWTLAITDVH